MGKRRGFSHGQIQEAVENAERSPARHCNLHNRELDDAAAAKLAELLAGSKLESVDLAENNIGDAGLLALAESLPRARRLATLNLADNHIGERGARRIMQVCADQDSFLGPFSPVSAL